MGPKNVLVGVFVHKGEVPPVLFEGHFVDGEYLHGHFEGDASDAIPEGNLWLHLDILCIFIMALTEGLRDFVPVCLLLVVDVEFLREVLVRFFNVI